jgi:DNA-binding response OmpR family regulator
MGYTQMTHPRSSATTAVVAILGTDALVENILARLLEREGYDVRVLGAYPTGLMDELLHGVDILLLAPGLKDGVREAFLEAMRSTQESAAIPVLPLSSALKGALLDELSASASWRTLLEELVGQIEAALQRAAASTSSALGGEGRGGEASAPRRTPRRAGHTV